MTELRLFHKRPIIPPTIVRDIPRPPAELVERLGKASVADISDKVGQLYTMDSGIRPLYQPIRKLAGVALTVKLPPGDNLMVQLALNMAQPGDVLVVDWRGFTEACGTGAGSMTPAIERGLAGVVIDGAWRDLNELQALDVPVFGRGISPYSPPKARPGEINVPVCCGGVIVEPGDVIVCDAEGCVVVPRKYAEAIADAVPEWRLNTTLEEWRAVRAGFRFAEMQRGYEEVFLAHGGTYTGPDANGSAS
jgi:4-hydroxy-4-methyl-2-oxoglutarate aldolase